MGTIQNVVFFMLTHPRLPLNREGLATF